MKQQDISSCQYNIRCFTIHHRCVCNVSPPAVIHYITYILNMGILYNRLWCCNRTGKGMNKLTQKKIINKRSPLRIRKYDMKYDDGCWWWEYILISWRFLWREHCEKCIWHAALLSEVSWTAVDQYWRIQLYWLWLSRHFCGSAGSQTSCRRLCRIANVERTRSKSK